MRKLIGAALFNLFLGMATHFVFYPVVMSWQNERVRLLGRPAIGVIAASLPFAVWIHTITPDQSNKDISAATGMSAYLASFLLFGAGTAFGYLVDDAINKKA